MADKLPRVSRAVQNARAEILFKFLHQYPEESKVRLAKLLHLKHADLFASIEVARNSIRYYTNSKGKVKAKEPVDTSIRKASQVYAMPKSKAKAWLPLVINEGTAAILGDIHFPKHDESALEASVSHILGQGDVDILILNGDIADAEEFSHWAKSPKALDTESALDVTRQGLLWLREKFSKSRIIYKLGNHEERLEKYCWQKAPELVGLPHVSWEGLLKIDNDLKPVQELADIEFVGDQRPIMLNGLPLFHGHELPKGLQNSVNPARGAFLRTIDSVAINHHHRSSSHVEYTWQHKSINCWSIGCLCDLTPEYARINKWNHGHAICDMSRTSYSLLNFKRLESGEIVSA
jgi:predicted phosphodiesterase